ncbi:hypothetical protein A7U60_g5549 [Sanghuangporus baumii]|uniref:Uncharacterized protein n=1 Tax=Sanghuangporus baumii TaxID=108892 RepID=A0A9Q5NBF1_SANBA|nr:hypothetical protein A7U60_g5549 [Sanghuangporus baumii]
MRSLVATACALALLAPVLAAPPAPSPQAPGAFTAAAKAAESHAPHPPRVFPLDLVLGAVANGSGSSHASATSTTSAETSTTTETITATSGATIAIGTSFLPIKRQTTEAPPTAGAAVVHVDPVVEPSANAQPSANVVLINSS